MKRQLYLPSRYTNMFCTLCFLCTFDSTDNIHGHSKRELSHSLYWFSLGLTLELKRDEKTWFHFKRHYSLYEGLSKTPESRSKRIISDAPVPSPPTNYMCHQWWRKYILNCWVCYNLGDPKNGATLWMTSWWDHCSQEQLTWHYEVERVPF